MVRTLQSRLRNIIRSDQVRAVELPTRDWNSAWNAGRNANEASWEITEPAIYYQAVYTLLLFQLTATSGGRGRLEMTKQPE